MDTNMDKPIYGFIMGALGLTSCVGHGLIRLALRGRPELRKQNYLLLSLGVSDFIIAVHAFMSTWASMSSEWPFGDIGCMLDSYLGMAATFASVSNAAWIAKGRYYKACKPKKYFSPQFAVKCLWIGSLLSGILPFLGFGEYGYETENPAYRTGCLLTFKDVGLKYWIYIIFISVMWFLWPLWDIVQSYQKIATAKQIFYWPLIVVPLQLLVSLVPYAAFAYITIFYNVATLPGIYVAINNIAAKIMIATNPYIYIATDEDLSRACAEYISGKKIAEEANKKEE